MSIRRDVKVDAGLRWGLSVEGPESGEAVLLLHGFPEDRRSWDLQMGPLAAAGYRVYAADLPGYGDTEAPTDYRLQTLADRVADLIRSLDPNGVHLVGHDWGGIIGHVVASTHPATVRTFTAACAPHPAAFSAVLSDPLQILRSWYVGVFQIPKIEKVLAAVGDDGIRRIIKGAQAPPFDEAGLGRALAYYRENLNPLRLGRSGGGRIPQPGLVIHASGDPAIGRSLMRATAERFDDLRAFEELDGGHFIHREKHHRFTGLVTHLLTSAT